MNKTRKNPARTQNGLSPKIVVFTFLAIAALAFFVTDFHSSTIIIPTIALGAITWNYVQGSQNLIFKALVKTILPVIIGLSILVLAMLVLNGMNIYQPEIDEIRAIEELPMNLSLWVKKWLGFSYWQFALILIGLFILNLQLPTLKLASGFVKFYGKVRSLSIALLVLTSFSFFSQYPNDQVLQKGYNLQIKEYNLRVEQNKTQIAKYLAASMQAVAIEQMGKEERKEIVRYFDKTTKNISNALWKQIFVERSRLNQKVSKDVAVVKLEYQVKNPSLSLNPILARPPTSLAGLENLKNLDNISNITLADGPQPFNSQASTSNKPSKANPVSSTRKTVPNKRFSGRGKAAYKKELLKRWETVKNLELYRQIGEEIASQTSLATTEKITQELLVSTSAKTIRAEVEKISPIDSRARFESNQKALAKFRSDIENNERMAIEAEKVLDKLIVNAFGFPSIESDALANTFFKKIVRTYAERVFGAQILDRFNVPQRLEKIDWSKASLLGLVQSFNPAAVIKN
ncbi:MAG: hypothetical protein AAGI38_15850, partial [Bacteroidota bacterium]